MTSTGGSKALAILVYTGLRLGLFLLVWLTIELLTPINGVWAIVVAIMVSGAIAIVVLDRPRDRVGAVAAGFFGGINDRIEASARAEDVDDDASSVVVGMAPAEAATTDEASGSGEGEQPAEHEAVDQQ